jgi:alginate O-acetyltransferase complex protein AlgJ
LFRKSADTKKQKNRGAFLRGNRTQTVFLWAIFAFSFLPFLIALTAATKTERGLCGVALEALPEVGSQCVALEEWYAGEVEPVQELRPLAAFPVVWQGHWFNTDKNYANFEKWFADNLGLRDLMIRAKNELDYRLFASSSRAYFGKDSDIYGRVLIDGELPATERLLDTPEKVEAVHNGVVSFSNRMKSAGVTVLLVTPMQKENFFPGRLPFFAPRLPESTNFMKLYRRLNEDADLNFIDVYGILKAHQDEYPIFYQQDFHWTDMAALAVAKETTNRIAHLENVTDRWQYPNVFELKPFLGSDARFAALLVSHEAVLEPQLKKLWSWSGVHLVKPLDAKQTGFELESDIVNNPDLLPSTCMYGNSFSDGMVRAGLFDHFQRFTTLDRSRSINEIPTLIQGRCKYLIVQILDISTPTWLSLKK